MFPDHEILDESQIKQEAIDIKKISNIAERPKRAGLLGIVKDVMDSIETRREHRKIIKAYEEEAYRNQKNHNAEEKFAKELDAAKKRGELKAKPLTERIKIKREEVKEKRSTREAPIDIRKTTDESVEVKHLKKGGIAGALARGTARMMETSSVREKPKMQLRSNHESLAIKRSDKKLWK